MAAMDEVSVRIDDEQQFEDIPESDDLRQLKSQVKSKRGRGFGDSGAGLQGQFDVVDKDDSGQGPQRSVEGWIVFISNIHEEATEEDLSDAFSEYGDIKNMHVNLDRRTGFLKGYALVEYDTYKEALNAIQKSNGSEILGQKIKVDWAFVKPKSRRAGHR